MDIKRLIRFITYAIRHGQPVVVEKVWPDATISGGKFEIELTIVTAWGQVNQCHRTNIIFKGKI